MSADGTMLVESPRTAGLDRVRVVSDTISVFDTARFEHMQRVAAIMAASTLVPESLRGLKRGESFEPYTEKQVLANCFLVANQAERWGMDPFALLQCSSIVHNKLTYEGKVIAAATDAKLGVRLSYEWSGDGEAMRVTVSGTLPDGVIESVEGSVAEWKTTGKNSPWRPGTYRKMLAYRGAREWARLYAPAVMLGVYSDDEMDGLNDRRLPPPQPSAAIAPPPRRAEDVIDVPAQRKRLQPPRVPKVTTSPAGSPSVAAKPPADEAGGDPPVDGAALIAHIGDELACCGDRESLDEAWEGVAELLDRLPRSDRERAIALYDQHAKRLAEAAP